MRSKTVALRVLVCGMFATLAAPSTLRAGSPPAAPEALRSARAGDGPTADSFAPGSHRLVGLVVPAAEVAVRARVDGVISKSAARAGGGVAAGDVLVLLDDSALLLEQQRQKARLSAISHHIAAARADLLLLQQRGEQLRVTRQNGAVSAYELNQNRTQAEGAAARVKALEDERREADIAARALEARARDYQCVAPIGGEIVEAARVPQEYVRAGEIVARVRSVRRKLRLNLPQPLAERLPELSFSLHQPGGVTVLAVADARAEWNLNGGRSVALEVPENVALTTGQTVEVEVTAP